MRSINIEASAGSIVDSYDNALAETINGLYKTEVIRHRVLWRTIEAAEFATFECTVQDIGFFGRDCS